MKVILTSIKNNRRTKVFFVALASVLLIFALAACSEKSESKDTGDGIERYHAALEAGKPIFLYFYTDSCSVCKKLDPTFQTVATDSAYSAIEVIKVDAGSKDNLTLSEKHKIYYVPALFAYDSEGDIIWQYVGALSEKDLREVFDSLLD